MAEELKAISAFVTTTPPIVHGRKDYKSKCYKDCKACEYLRLQRAALDALLSLLEKEEVNDDE